MQELGVTIKHGRGVLKGMVLVRRMQMVGVC